MWKYDPNNLKGIKNSEDNKIIMKSSPIEICPFLNSINATIVIFDRIRENRRANRRSDVNELADKSITQTMARSINTTLTTLFTIVAVFIFVPSVRDFSFPIIIGILSGTYSSIVIAPSVWSLLEKRVKKSTK